MAMKRHMRDRESLEAGARLSADDLITIGRLWVEAPGCAGGR